MTKLLVIFLLLINLTACHSSKKVIGKYTSANDKTMIIHKLELKPDSTFVYKIYGDLIDITSTGKWGYDSNKLFLNSADEFRPGIIEVVEKQLPIEKFKLKVVDHMDSPLSQAAVILNSEVETEFNLDDTGEAEIPIDSLHNIEIFFFGEKYEYVITPNRVNFLKLKIRLNDTSILYFKNEAWKIKRNTLIGEKDLILYK